MFQQLQNPVLELASLQDLKIGVDSFTQWVSESKQRHSYTFLTPCYKQGLAYYSDIIICHLFSRGKRSNLYTHPASELKNLEHPSENVKETLIKIEEEGIQYKGFVEATQRKHMLFVIINHLEPVFINKSIFNSNYFYIY